MKLQIAFALMLAAMSAGTAGAQPGAIVRTGPADAAISATVALPADARLVYVSGTVPDAANPQAAPGSVERYGDTETQTRSIISKIEALLKAQGMGLSDIVMMRVFLAAPPGQARMDFTGMMRGYRAFFGTAGQPNKPARSTMQVAGLVDPGWLVEIEATAARR